MWKNINLEECIFRIHQLSSSENRSLPAVRPSVTISRMAGAGGRTVASRLADELQPYAPYGYHWTVFDKNLIEKVLEDHHLSKQLAEYLPESTRFSAAGMPDGLRHHNISVSTVVKHSVETIWKLANNGFVILVGRAANIITAKMENVLHARLVGSMEKRIARLENVYDFDRSAAHEYLKAQDLEKKRYVKEFFGRDIEDPLLYHLIINTDGISYDKAAHLIADAVVSRFKLRHCC
ncbi:MAG TPA: cytidylate kinase-like family protein [Verrucomicrobiae bacterium]|nr:cytidylate kinase-like family protein [Verrucomicrobiae bacterium]